MLEHSRISGHELAFHRFSIGNRSAAVVSDGPLLLTPPGEVFTTLAPNLIDDALRDAFLPTGPMRIEQNILLLDLDGELALFDNGLGSSQLFGPHAGRLVRSLSEAGVQPEQIGAMVFSHAHPDHCWGTMRDDGTPTFPNAAIYMAEEELAFWEHCDDPEMTAVVEGVQKHLVPLRHRMRFFRDNEEFLPACARSQRLVTRRATRSSSSPRGTSSCACHATSRFTTRCRTRFRRARAPTTTTRLWVQARELKR
jgi:Metallo-beta-lactamase superfamily